MFLFSVTTCCLLCIFVLPVVLHVCAQGPIGLQHLNKVLLLFFFIILYGTEFDKKKKSSMFNGYDIREW